METVNIIGAGLAGSEAALYLAKQGIKVRLFEMRPLKMGPAHHSNNFAELVCSNSLKSMNIDNACGLLKQEIKLLGSIIMEASEHTSVPSGSALSVDREEFSKYITAKIKNEPLIEIVYQEVETLPEGITIIATGPLTSEVLTKNLQTLIGQEFLNFFDASAPIIEKDSIDLNVAYYKSRYDKGEASYLNCAFTKEQYELFYRELVNAKLAPLKDFEHGYFEGCKPIEVMAKSGVDTLRHGPLKPRGLRKTFLDKPYAVAQLRQDNVSGSLFNLVGFQTNLTYGEQKRVFRLIPGLENAEFVRYGLMHRNTYVNAPGVLNYDLSLKVNPNIYIAGQLSGVEGYVESAATGIIAAINVTRRLKGLTKIDFSTMTMIGSLLNYVANANPIGFAPMNANFGIFPGARKLNHLKMAERAIAHLKDLIEAESL
ncbi:MAG TPA: methylenetetrahydrofolate--tRNA-(uracil(54)-C(5))-methyltransferase (FADH(2)-oxidizing) TrmFO [Bacilli bacterium]|nr:methylenetetrahydrofolate--tRNA-(uracil(54)-C(5))-methyltransferase (FADH(2)-oxidizing) TrmFO [Bacilli bacterium]